MKSEDPARLTLIGMGGYGAVNRIKEFKVLNKINQNTNNQKKQKNKNLSMKEKQKHRHGNRHGLPLVGSENIKNLVGKEIPAAGCFAPASRLILQ